MKDILIKNIAKRLIHRPPYEAEATLYLFRKRDEQLAEDLLQEMFLQVSKLNSK